MKHLCASCTVCEQWGIPKQESVRVLSVFGDGSPSPILIIDDHQGNRDFPYRALSLIFGMDSPPYEYTQTIRCTYEGGIEFKEVAAHCAVWTNFLINNRSIILTTSSGMKQMGLNVAWSHGKIYKSPAHGLILSIPPLWTVDEDEAGIYRTQLKRMIRSVDSGEAL
jgi:hypothetical protein